MATFDSKNTLTVNLSNTQPTTVDTVFTDRVAMQGNTLVTFDLIGVENNIVLPGVQGLLVNFGDSDVTTFSPASFSGSAPVPLKLSTTTYKHTYYQSQSGVNLLSATFSILYQPQASAKPLSAKHIIEFQHSSKNIVDKNLEVLNCQLFTYNGTPTPIINVESGENAIYTFAYHGSSSATPISIQL